MTDLPPPPPSSGRPPGAGGTGPLIGLPSDDDIRRQEDNQQWQQAARGLEDPQLEPEAPPPANLEPVDHGDTPPPDDPGSEQKPDEPSPDFQHADIEPAGEKLELAGPRSSKKNPRGDLPAVSEPKQVEQARPRAISPSLAPPQGRVGLFGPDMVTNLIVGVAIGLLVGVVPAMRAAQGLSRSTVDPLVRELEESIDRPLAVGADELRAPRAIRGDIDDRRRDARARYFLVWFAVAVPVGAALGLIRRRVA